MQGLISNSASDRRLTLSIETITRSLVATAIALVLISLTTQIAAHAFDLKPERLSFSFFNLDAERNIPTTFQALLLLACAAVLGTIGALKHLLGERWRRHWLALSLVFTLLAWDEITEIHEHLIHLLRPLGFSGIFYFAWIVPAAPLVALLSVAFARFVLALPPRTRLRFCLAAAVFLFATFPLEATGGWYYERIGERANIRYVLLTTLEESLEIAAMILFLHAVTTYLAEALSLQQLTLGGFTGGLHLQAHHPAAMPGRDTAAISTSSAPPGPAARSARQANQARPGRD